MARSTTFAAGYGPGELRQPPETAARCNRGAPCPLLEVPCHLHQASRAPTPHHGATTSSSLNPSKREGAHPSLTQTNRHGRDPSSPHVDRATTMAATTPLQTTPHRGQDGPLPTSRAARRHPGARFVWIWLDPCQHATAQIKIPAAATLQTCPPLASASPPGIPAADPAIAQRPCSIGRLAPATMREEGEEERHRRHRRPGFARQCCWAAARGEGRGEGVGVAAASVPPVARESDAGWEGRELSWSTSTSHLVLPQNCMKSNFIKFYHIYIKKYQHL